MKKMNENIELPNSDVINEKTTIKDDQENTIIEFNKEKLLISNTEIPDGGPQAWSVIFGCFCGIFAM